jgi:predicted DNA-binding protein
MIATVRLNSELEEVLNSISSKLHKKKSDVIREAISYYADSLEQKHKTRMQKAVSKTMKSDFKEYKSMEESLEDGL